MKPASQLQQQTKSVSVDPSAFIMFVFSPAAPVRHQDLFSKSESQINTSANQAILPDAPGGSSGSAPAGLPWTVEDRLRRDVYYYGLHLPIKKEKKKRYRLGVLFSLAMLTAPSITCSWTVSGTRHHLLKGTVLFFFILTPLGLKQEKGLKAPFKQNKKHKQRRCLKSQRQSRAPTHTPSSRTFKGPFLSALWRSSASVSVKLNMTAGRKTKTQRIEKKNQRLSKDIFLFALVFFCFCFFF